MQVTRLHLPRPASSVQSSQLQVEINLLMLAWVEVEPVEDMMRESMIIAISQEPIYWAELTSPLIFNPVNL